MPNTFKVGDKVELTYEPSRIWNGAATVTAVGTLGHRPYVSLKMEAGRMMGVIGAFYLDATDTTITPAADFAVGDTVEITSAASFGERFIGFQAKVLRMPPLDGFTQGDAYLQPLTERPDGNKFIDFYWKASQLKKVPAPTVSDELREAAAELAKVSDALFELELTISRLTAALS